MALKLVGTRSKILQLGTIHKRRRQFFWIFETPLPHVGNFDQLLTSSQLPTSFMDGPLQRLTVCFGMTVYAKEETRAVVFFIQKKYLLGERFLQTLPNCPYMFRRS